MYGSLIRRTINFALRNCESSVNFSRSFVPNTPFVAAHAQTTIISRNSHLQSLIFHNRFSTTIQRSEESSHIMERTSAETRSKRKRNQIASNHERPAKQLKPELSTYLNGDATMTPNDDSNMSEASEEEGRLLSLATAAADTAEWQATIEKVVRNVVSIHFCQTFSFDTDGATSSEATGFVVDAEKGYILTNRHVVCAGPFWGYCIFDNHEEVRNFYHPLHITLPTLCSVMSTQFTVTQSTTLAFYASTLKLSNTCHLKRYNYDQTRQE